MRAWRLNILALCVLWAFGVIAGLCFLTNYELTAGAAGGAPAQWPSASKLKISRARPTIVMVAHPQCPCTRASISELAQLMTAYRGRVLAFVVFLSPKSMPNDWEKTDLWYSAAAIPGVTVVADCDGAETRRFQAETSGQTLIYGVDGTLLFSGGITGSRGHIGDNAGLQTAFAILDKAPINKQHNLVFGCSLKDPLTTTCNRDERYARASIGRRQPGQ